MSGTRVTIDGGDLVVEPLGLDRLWSFTRRIRLPLSQVQHAFFDPSVLDEPKGLRLPGLHVPGKAAGTFRSGGRRQFWNVTGSRQAIVVSLADGAPYDRLILTVDDPHGTVDAINGAPRLP